MGLKSDIEFPCASGDYYSVSVMRKESSAWPGLILAVITKDEILDVGLTTAEYGSVFLSGTR